MEYVIGLDIGTSGAKGLLVDVQSGAVCAMATEEYVFVTPRPLWAEQNPLDWWEATKKVFRKLAGAAGQGSVVGIGLTGQMHGLVILDKNGRPLRPCIMWNDQRTADECAEITRLLGPEKLLQITGNPALPGFTAPKILWVRRHEPDIYRLIAHVLLPKDYIRYCLTGDFATEVSDASGMVLLDVRRRDWSQEVCDRIQIPVSWLAQVFESPAMTGSLSSEAAEATGLRAGTPVVGGGGDQAAGGVGNGIVSAGVVSVTVGTSGVVFAHTDALAIEEKGRLHAFCHAVPGAWHVMGVTLAAGGSFRWYRDALCAEEKAEAGRRGIDVYEILTAAAEKVPAGSEGLVFLPYLSGERTPYPDPKARGGFIGLTLRHRKAHLTRALLEGVAFSLRDCFVLMNAMKLPSTEIRISGGGARSPLWRQIIADVLAAPVVMINATDGAPYGAALLATVGTGRYRSVPEACARAIKVVQRTEPVTENVKRYADLYGSYRELYPSLSTTFHSLTDFATVS